MSDKKTPTNPPQGTVEQEFERLLRGEDTATAATYRKLPSAEPDAQLDARVRALARHALRESPPAAADAESGDGGARADSGRARGARWMPAFASAAVLVLAAGIVWQLGPRNWARKEATTDVALDATVARNAPPAASEAAPGPAASAASRSPPAAKPAGVLQPDAAGETKAPPLPTQPFPAESREPRAAIPPVSGTAPAGSAPEESRKQEAARDAAPFASQARAPESAAPAREKRAGELAAPAELEKTSPGAPQASISPVPANRAARVDERGLNGGAARAPAAPAAARVAPVPPAPPPPVVTAESTPLRDETVTQEATPARITMTTPAPASSDARATAFPASPAAAPSPDDARRQDERARELATQRAEATAAGPAIGNAKARASASAAPAPAPMQSAADAPESKAAADAAPSKPKISASTAAAGTEVQQQAYTDHFALPPDAPPAKVPGRPTAAELAAWPAPNCHAAGTTPNPDVRNWHYPPDVPDSAHLRFAIVKTYLEAESPEGARKAYADFRHCYPDDRWPPSLLRRLGVQ